MTISALLFVLLTPFAPALNIASLLFEHRATAAYELLEVISLVMASVDVISWAIFSLQIAVVAKITARAMGYDIVIRLCQ
ncbi:unnamed protein product [Cylicocyclus nassatus]|uniref:Uncharacterized protein n=1 Tax=Cylicocyclus nassatus TaxID=53992 RepID=A0AA36H677_CYLNA|nr:unnamed protein product [Cylicocyclus nassatus]